MTESKTKKTKFNPGSYQPPGLVTPGVRLLIVIVGVAAYLNSFQGVFIFDGSVHILENEKIHRLWPPVYLFETDRPLVYFSFAVNYALGKGAVWGYHFVNMFFHIATAVLLYEILCQTFFTQRLKSRFAQRAAALASVISLLWLVHPLQTESVTYIYQRAESMVGMFYLLTLYCVIRLSVTERLFWGIGAVMACWLGMVTKPVMFTAPVVILIYDRIFLTASWKTIWEKRGRYYLGMLASWAFMGILIRSLPNLETDIKGITPLKYALTQPEVMLHYLKLSFWPHPLVLDYQWPAAENLRVVFFPASVILGLLLLTVWALMRCPELGFCGVWFFFILAPTSSFNPLADPAVEHRMYLPLAAVIAAAVIMADRALNAISFNNKIMKAGLAVTVIAIFSFLTIQRNMIYHDEIKVWQDVLNHRPNNSRAMNNLGWYLFNQGNVERGLAYIKNALALDPDAQTYTTYAAYCLQTGKLEEAEVYLKQATALNPRYTDAYVNLGTIFLRRKDYERAIKMYEKAIALEPDYAVIYNNIGSVYLDTNRPQEAVSFFRKALELGLREAGVYHNLGVAYVQTGQPVEAIESMRDALRVDPNFSPAKEDIEQIQSKLK